MKNYFSVKLMALLGFFLCGIVSSAQNQKYTIAADPGNKARKIITLPPIREKAPEVKVQKNVLDAEPTFKQASIAHQPFVFINPKTKKPVDPNAKLTMKLPDGTTRTFTAKQFYEQANELEKQLNARGRSLRNPHALRGMRLPVKTSGFATQQLQAGFITNYVEAPKGRVTATGRETNSGRETVQTGSGGSNGNVINVGNINVINKPATPGFNKMNLTWSSDLYVAKMGQTHGTPEFPAEWKPASLPGKGKKTFPLLVAVPKGMDGLVKKIEWQVSDKPFDKTLKDYNTGVLKSATYDAKWSTAYLGIHDLKSWDKFTYSHFYIDLGTIAPEPANSTKPYYARAILYNASNDMINVTDNVVLNYGAETVDFKIAMPEINSVPGFSYAFPEDKSIPFGVFVRGNGLQTVKTTQYTDAKYTKLETKGFRASANASLGIRYYNFMSLVDKSQPSSNEMVLISGNFRAVAGKGTSPTQQDEANGIKLDIGILNNTFTYPIEFTEKLPGNPNAVSLNYNVEQSLEKEVVNTWFFIGPVPIHLYAGFGGSTGLKISGHADLSNLDVSASITPYITSNFYAGGGVDAIIAFATINAKVDPLLGIELPMTINSTSKSPLSFSANLKGLAGRIYLRVGFYYPCPDLEKIVGWLTGDEDVPFCECAWEYNIFDYPGFEHKWSY